jgi:integrative and conjugative element protein (TIGR02256 family)
MQFVSGWSTDDRRLLLNFEDKVLAVFQEYIQQGHADNEAGGLLLGEVRGEHLNILEATIPTAHDKRMRYFFERLPLGHASVAQQLWTKSRGTVRYLGEWHTHPQDVPIPSGTDRSEWTRMASERKDKRPFLAVIVGRTDLHVELVRTRGPGRVFVPCPCPCP